MNKTDKAVADSRTAASETPQETILALRGVLQGIIDLANDPAGSTFTLRQALNQYEFKSAIEWLNELTP